VKVLKERVQEKLLVLRGSHDRGDGLKSRLATGPEAALSHDELVARRTHLAYDDRLEKPDLLDGGDELRESVLVEDLARLSRVRRDVVEGQFGEVSTDRRLRRLQGSVRQQLLCFM
jgi:hypothetical protein